MSRTWSGVLARLGVPTGDGRIIAPGGGSSRKLPLPLLYQAATDDGHGGAVVVGRIETMAFDNGMVTATGSMLDAAYGTDVMELLDAGVIGPSVDLDDIEYTMDAQERIVITSWRVAGATLVAIPAFADVSVTLDPMPAEPVPSEAMERPRELDWEPFALNASASPEALPPLDWFRAPDLDRLTPVTVSDSGRVFGHIAGWDTCHVGLPGCVTAPFSSTGYAYFHVGEQRCADGSVMAVGTLVAGPRHADPQMAFKAAQQHYDDPSAAVARVVAGEDDFGIWVAGWMLPGASPEAREVFTSSPVSGDWRRIGGALELIAVCSVNTPGFPVPRARVAFSSGAQQALIGSFGITPQTGPEPVRHGPTPERVAKAQESINERARARWAWANRGTE